MYKICNKCNENLSLDLYHKCKGGKLGKHSICKQCRKEKKEKKEINNECRLCTRCRSRKLTIDFYSNSVGYCKDCQKLAISNSLSKLEPYLNMLYKRFIKKYKKKSIVFTISELHEKYKRCNGKCNISGIEMQHIVNTKQQIDNIWNIAILYNGEQESICIDDIELVCHLAKTMKTLYQMSVDTIKESIHKLHSCQ